MPAALCPGETRPDASGAVDDSVDAIAAEGRFRFPGAGRAWRHCPTAPGPAIPGSELQALCGGYRRIRDPRPFDLPGGAGGWAHRPICRPYRDSGSRCLRDPEPRWPACKLPGGRHTMSPGAGPKARRWPHRSRRVRARPQSKGGAGRPAETFRERRQALGTGLAAATKTQDPSRVLRLPGIGFRLAATLAEAGWRRAIADQPGALACPKTLSCTTSPFKRERSIGWIFLCTKEA